jgi:hypothetical protein
MSVEEDLTLMKTFDDSWDAQDWKTFNARRAKPMPVSGAGSSGTHQRKEDDLARLVSGHDAVLSAFNPGWHNPDIYIQQIKGTCHY